MKYIGLITVFNFLGSALGVLYIDKKSLLGFDPYSVVTKKTILLFQYSLISTGVGIAAFAFASGATSFLLISLTLTIFMTIVAITPYDPPHDYKAHYYSAIKMIMLMMLVMIIGLERFDTLFLRLVTASYLLLLPVSLIIWFRFNKKMLAQAITMSIFLLWLTMASFR